MSSLRSKNSNLALITAVLIVLNFGCSKDVMTPDQEVAFADRIVGFEHTTGAMDLAMAKRYYEQLKLQKGEFVKPQTFTNPNPNYKPNLTNKRYPLFNQAHVSETKKSTAVEIPMRFDTRSVVVHQKKDGAKLSAEESKMIVKHSMDRLVVYKNKATGKIGHWMLTYTPTLAYLKKRDNQIKHNHLGKLDKEFSGYITYKRWDGTPVYTLVFNNGKRTGYSRPKSAMTAQRGK